jgi:hypothetical protein
MVRKTSDRHSSREVGAFEAQKVDCSAFDRNPQPSHVVSGNVLWSDEFGNIDVPVENMVS